MAVPDPTLDPGVAARLKRDATGLVCAVVQAHDTGQVLMVGWMDDEALARTLTSGRVTLWSRSRQEYWRKGDTSGCVQYVRSVALDCDGDAVLVRVEQVGAACHTGARSCFDVQPLAVTGGMPARSPALGDERERGPDDGPPGSTDPPVAATPRTAPAGAKRL